MNLKEKSNNNKKQQIFDFIFKYLAKDIMNYQDDNFKSLISNISEKFKLSKQDVINFIKDFRTDNRIISKILDSFDSLYKDVLNYENLLKSKNIQINEKFFNSLIKKIESCDVNSNDYIKSHFFYIYFSNKYDFGSNEDIDVKTIN